MTGRFLVSSFLTQPPLCTTASAGQGCWQESFTRYRLTNVETFPSRVWSQGFTVKQP